MATMIAADCINCGACEPECPNNAISQGDPIFVIDPKLCTECVGFHDYEACAAVCPVDVCITDPNNIESEEVLIARAKELHPETQFGDNFESRFRKGQGKGAAPDGAAQADGPAAAAAAAAPAAVSGGAAAVAEREVAFIELPDIDSWTLPMRCFKCNQTQVEPVTNFTIGNVIFCRHCHKSTVVRDNLNYHIRTLLKDSYDKWQAEQSQFIERRERELAQFLEKRAKEAAAFEAHQERELAQIHQQLDALGDNYDAPGRPVKKGARFGWG
jgi:NAD-dependent dihydropyrimidine dehydrogenase PreA subunit